MSPNRPRSSSRFVDRLGPAALGALCLAWLGYALSLVGVASASPRLAGIFISDDGGNAAGVVHMLTRHTLDYHHAFYPGLYFNLSALLTLLVHAFGVGLPHASLLVTRTVSAVGGAATLLLTGLLARRLSGRWSAALVAAGILATSPRYFTFSVVAHPDTLQTALMVASILVLIGYVAEDRRRSLLWAAALAGLALATKYAGAFLVPAIAGAVVVVARRRHGASTREMAREVGGQGLRAGAVFLGAALAAHPRFLVAGHVYLHAISVQRSWHAFGHFLRSTGPASTWLTLLCGPALVGPVTGVAFLLGPAFAVWLWLRRDALALTAPRAFGYAATASVGALYLGFLLHGMRDFAPRFLFPAVPFVAAFSAAALFDAAAALPRPRLRASALVAVAVWGLVAIPLRFPHLARASETRRSVMRDPRIAVGRWLDTHVPPDTPLIFDHYTYVPERFPRSVATWGLRPRELHQVAPAVIVTNQHIRGRFADPSLANSNRWGPKVYLAIHRDYADLLAGRLDGFRLVARFPSDDTRVYARPPLAGRLLATSPPP